MIEEQKKIYFLTNQEKKYNELREMFDLPGFVLEKKIEDIPELQIEDDTELVKKKVLAAFEKIKRPVLVEHTALKINAFGELPGLQTRNFYSKMGYKRIIKFCGTENNYDAEVKSILGFCDGKKIYIESGCEEGEIIRGEEAVVDGFDWDVIFIPSQDNPGKQTYAEMGEKKNERSMRKKAWDALKSKIENANQSLFCGDDQEEMEKLAQLIADKKVILFVGAGISASVGLPAWDKLIEQIGVKKGIDSDLFKGYGNFMMLAEYADDVGIYENVKETFDVEDNETIQTKLRDSQIYKKIYELDFPIIYTTNYDHLIEQYYAMQGEDKSVVVSKISDMEKINPQKTRIMKFHGDVKEEGAIVLSESQYFERMDFQNFMDIQLQADMLQYSILFIGYSLSDINIKLLLYLAQKRWKNIRTEEDRGNIGERKHSYIFTTTPNYVQKSVFEKNGIISLSGNIADKEEGTLDFLKRLSEYVVENK